MGTPEAVAWAPGRVNLIGEHTDYNRGLCLPSAIERGVTVRAQGGGSGFEVHAGDRGEADAFAPDAIEPRPGWRGFARGAVSELLRAGFPLRPARLEISADLPAGAGLGSSAALTVSLCLSLLAVAGVREGDRLALARLCSRVENEWLGARTGLLDQLAVLFARENHALRLDLEDASMEPVALELGAWRLVTVDSGTRHAHSGGSYNDRRRECSEACRRLGLASLREARMGDAGRLPAPLDRRVRHVLTENRRVDATVEALRRADLPAVGDLLDESHASLRDDFEVSVPAVDELVSRLKAGGARGARIIGGGFGGQVLALLPPGTALPEGAAEVRAAGAARVEVDRASVRRRHRSG